VVRAATGLYHRAAPLSLWKCNFRSARALNQRLPGMAQGLLRDYRFEVSLYGPGVSDPWDSLAPRDIGLRDGAGPKKTRRTEF